MQCAASAARATQRRCRDCRVLPLARMRPYDAATSQPAMHAAIVLLILILTYVGMAAGRIAWLRVDRTGIALLAVIALLASGADDARRFRQRRRHADPGAAVRDDDHLGAIRRIGLYRSVRPHDHREPARRSATLLALTVAIGGGLSAVLANDILIIAIAPLADRRRAAAAASTPARSRSRSPPRPMPARPRR